jgi:hypothetical protein
MAFPARNFLGDLMAVASLYAFYTLYTGLGTLVPGDPARQRTHCFIIGVLAISLPLILTRLLAIALRVPISII